MSSFTTAMKYDWIIRAGRVVCVDQGLNGPGSVAITGDRIVATNDMIQGQARRVINVPDAILLPGLIDLHAHPAKSGSKFGVEPDQNFLTRGTTTVLSQGDAGSAGCGNYVTETIQGSQTRVILALNLSSVGEAASAGCFSNLQTIDVAKCLKAIELFNPFIWGISVNASHHCCGATDPREVLQRGIQVAESSGLPLLYGMRRPEDWQLHDQLERLRPGDVVTYCFRRTPHCIVEFGRVIEAVRKASERGVIFDLGHGRSSFDFDTAETALRDGFFPDTLSTDLQAGHLREPNSHDLPLVMSKLQAAGMPEMEIFRAVTLRPAQVLRRENEIGTLRSGSYADITLLRWQEAPACLTDTHDHHRYTGLWETILTFKSGNLFPGPRYNATAVADTIQSPQP